MRVITHKKFRKSLEKLTPNQKARVSEALKLFRKNPYDPQLENHPLHGKQRCRRAVSAGGDLRIIFLERNNYEVVQLITVGTHNQVYY